MPSLTFTLRARLLRDGVERTHSKTAHCTNLTTTRTFQEVFDLMIKGPGSSMLVFDPVGPKMRKVSDGEVYNNITGLVAKDLFGEDRALSMTDALTVLRDGETKVTCTFEVSERR